jgi:dTDP-glucose 4,6-dehydratase
MDGTKLARLGWQRRIPFEDGLKRTIAWYVDNQAWWRQAKGAEWSSYYERQYGERLADSASA